MAGRTRSGRGRASARKASPRGEVPPTRQTADTSATGLQIKVNEGKQDIPKGKEAGSLVPVAGGEPTPDHKGPQKPRGDQAKPALFTSNGSLESGVVASPTGPVPVAAAATSQKHAEQLVEEHEKKHAEFIHRRAQRTKLSEATVHRLGRSELQALAQQRGYDLPDAGTRSTRDAFLREQAKDKNLRGEA